MHRLLTRHFHIRRIQGKIIAHCFDDNDDYAELNFKEYKPGWHKAKPVDKFYVKYDPNNNLPTHEATLPYQIDKEVEALESAVCVTNEANQNLAPSQKELLRWHFRLLHIGFQHVQWLIRTGRLKVKVNPKVVAN